MAFATCSGALAIDEESRKPCNGVSKIIWIKDFNNYTCDSTINANNDPDQLRKNFLITFDKFADLHKYIDELKRLQINPDVILKRKKKNRSE